MWERNPGCTVNPGRSLVAVQTVSDRTARFRSRVRCCREGWLTVAVRAGSDGDGGGGVRVRCRRRARTGDPGGGLGRCRWCGGGPERPVAVADWRCCRGHGDGRSGVVVVGKIDSPSRWFSLRRLRGMAVLFMSCHLLSRCRSRSSEVPMRLGPARASSPDHGARDGQGAGALRVSGPVCSPGWMLAGARLPALALPGPSRRHSLRRAWWRVDGVVLRHGHVLVLSGRVLHCPVWHRPVVLAGLTRVEDTSV
jgi:hypothetical protein